MNKKISKKDFLSNIECFLDVDKFEAIEELKISSNNASVLIYNTNDLWLSKPQFDVLTKLISPQKTLYVAQKDSEDIYELELPIKYEEYSKLDLFSISFIASEKFDWVIVMDEGLESGIGILIGNPDFVKQYISKYENGLKDLYDLITFHYRSNSRNSHSIEKLMKILSFAHPYDT